MKTALLILAAGVLAATGARAGTTVDYQFNGEMYWRNTAGASPWPTFFTGTFTGSVTIDLGAPILAFHAGTWTASDPEVVTYDASSTNLTLALQLLDGTGATRSLAVSNVSVSTTYWPDTAPVTTSQWVLQGTIDPVAGISTQPIPIELDITRSMLVVVPGQNPAMEGPPLIDSRDFVAVNDWVEPTLVDLRSPWTTQAGTGFLLLLQVDKFVPVGGGGDSAAVAALGTQLAAIQNALDTKASQASVDAKASQSSVDTKASQASVDALQESVNSLLATLADMNSKLDAIEVKLHIK
jgi:hypothetical protein